MTNAMTECDFHRANKREHIASLLAEAQRVICSPQSDAMAAAWRVADAGLLLRQLLEADSPPRQQMGLDVPTSRGAVLPGLRQLTEGGK